MNFSNQSKFLLVRPDKIGDLLLTTPALQALKELYPQSTIGFLASSYAAPLLENNPAINFIFKIEANESYASLWKLSQTIRQRQFDASFHFYVDAKSILATALAGIPFRAGPFSKMASLLLTKRIVQNRSSVEKHEADYNLDLLRTCGIPVLESQSKIYLTQEEKKWGKDYLNSLLKNPNANPILIHPGSKGSVQSWPLEYFLELSKKIGDKLGEVLITGGIGEEALLKTATQLNHPHIHVVQAGSLTLRQLAAVIFSTRLVISNSTGPLHMAVALGTPTLSFYPNLPMVTSSKRWGPYSKETCHKVLSPQTLTAPLSTITVEKAFLEINQLF